MPSDSKRPVILSLFAGTRYLIIIPITGLVLAAAILFVVGGYGLIKLVFTQVLTFLGIQKAHEVTTPIYVELVEYIHTFLIGTVLFITAVGFFQLFIKAIDLPGWLRIKNTEELETNLIGVTVVVLAVNFMAMAFKKPSDFILEYGAGIALLIVALSVFMGIRAWSHKLACDEHDHQDDQHDAMETAADG